MASFNLLAGIFSGGLLGFEIAYLVLLIVGIVLVVMPAYKQGRSGWWIYLILVILPILFQLIAIIGWFAAWKAKPMKLGDLTM